MQDINPSSINLNLHRSERSQKIETVLIIFVIVYWSHSSFSSNQKKIVILYKIAQICPSNDFKPIFRIQEDFDSRIS